MNNNSKNIKLIKNACSILLAKTKHYSTILFDTGFFHIVGSSFINKIINMVFGILVVRLVSQNDYGIYTYAMNIASFFILFNGMGASSAALQICSELYKNKLHADMVFNYARRWGVVVDVIMGICILAVGAFIPLAIQGSNGLLMLYCLNPLLSFLCDIRLIYLRIWLRNQDYSLMTFIQTVASTIVPLAGIVIAGVTGLVIGNCIALCVTYIIMIWKIPYKLQHSELKLSNNVKRDFRNIALISALNNSLSQALTLIGTFFIGLFLTSSKMVAIYNIATIIPFALLFAPGMLITYIYPYFARNKNNREWTISYYKKYTIGSLFGMGAITIICIVLARPIIFLLFGEQYDESISAFQVLMIGFLITSVFRQPVGNLLVTQRKLVFNFINGLIQIAVCVFASLVFIPTFSVIGAALAYDTTMFVGAILSTVYYIYTIKHI